MICMKCSQIFELAQKICTGTKHFGSWKRARHRSPEFCQSTINSRFFEEHNFFYDFFFNGFRIRHQLYSLIVLPFIFVFTIFNQKIPQATDTQWRYQSKIYEKLGRCGRQNLLWPYLKIWE